MLAVTKHGTYCFYLFGFFFCLVFSFGILVSIRVRVGSGLVLVSAIKTLSSS